MNVSMCNFDDNLDENVHSMEVNGKSDERGKSSHNNSSIKSLSGGSIFGNYSFHKAS